MPTDAPDWQRIITGSGGVTPTVGANFPMFQVYQAMGALGMTVTPMYPTNSSQLPGAGNMFFLAFTAFASGTINKVLGLVTGGASCTANENFFCIYDWGQTTAATFTLLTKTVAGAIDTALDTNALLTATFSPGASVIGGQPYAVGLLTNGGRPAFAAKNPSAAIVDNPLGTAGPVFVNQTATGHTTPSASVAWSACVTNNWEPWLMVTS